MSQRVESGVVLRGEGGPTPLAIEESWDADQHTLALSGDLDMCSARLLRARVTGLPRGCRPRLVIDLERVGFIDSKGIDALLLAAAEFSGDGRSLVLTGVASNHMKVLEMSGMASRLQFADDGVGKEGP